MNIFTKLAAVSALAAGSVITAQAQTLADWTFETSVPAGTPGAGVYITNIVAEVGSGTASGLHAGNSVYSTPSGNDSTHAFSSTLWAVGDFYQFSTSTLGDSGIALSWNETSSGTGPSAFTLEYSTDGVSFTSFANYTVTNTGWSPTIASTTSSYADDLSSITALNNDPVVYFRLVDANNSVDAAGTAAVGTGGTDRVDNFTISEAPEPSTMALGAMGAMGGLATLFVIRRRQI